MTTTASPRTSSSPCQPDEHELRLLWLVLADGRPVGRVGVDLPLEGDSRVAFLLIELLRGVHGRGIGTAAYGLVERTAREHGRSVLQTWTEHPDGPGPRLEAPTEPAASPRTTAPHDSSCG